MGNFLSLARLIAPVIVEMSTSYTINMVLNDITKTLLIDNPSKIAKVMTKIGVAAIAGYTGNIIAKNTAEQIDSYIGLLPESKVEEDDKKEEE